MVTVIMLTVVGFALSPSAAAVTITYTDLHPGQASESSAYAVSGTQQAGRARLFLPGLGIYDHATVWSGTAGSLLDLHPAGAVSSQVNGLSGSQQAGFAIVGSYPGPFPNTNAQHAALWSGTAASFVDLHPAGAAYSLAHGIGDSQQVGAVRFDTNALPDLEHEHAALWTGTAASFVDLHPLGASYTNGTSGSYGTSGTQQVGYVRISAESAAVIAHAALWSGTASSFADLHPWGMWRSSFALAASGGQQVGYAIVSTNQPAAVEHAMLWSGTAHSFVDLHPGGALRSKAYATTGSQQAGYAQVFVAAVGTHIEHAALWSGTANSFVDLHTVLGSNYETSRAEGMWSDGETTYVVGSAQSTTPGFYGAHAILWTIQADEHCGYTLASLNAGCGPTATNGTFSVVTTRNCHWMASSTNDWLHTSSAGLGNGTVTYAVDANPGHAFRTGIIFLGGQTFTITQGGAGWWWNGTYGWLWDSGSGWYWNNTFGWLWFSGDWAWSDNLQGWLLGDGYSAALWSNQFRWLVPSGNDDGNAYTTTMREISIGAFGGWVWSSTLGWIGAAGDGTWFWTPQYGWLGATDIGGIWSVDLGQFLFW